MKKLTFHALYWALLSVFPVGAVQALSLQMVPSSTVVTVGDTFNLNFVISGLGKQASPSLSTFDFDVLFNSTVLGVNTSDSNGDAVIDSVVLDPSGQLDLFGLGLNFVSASLTSPSTLNLFDLSFDSPTDLDSLQTDQFTLASITFTALAAGSNSFKLRANSFGDSSGNLLNIDLRQPLTMDVSSSTQPQPIPEPTTLGLVLAGVATGGLLRKKRNKD